MIRRAAMPAPSTSYSLRNASLLNGLAWAAIGALTLWAATVRAWDVDAMRMHLDALHPYIGALTITEGVDWPWRGVGTDFRFGALQAWLSVPFVFAADSSAEVFTRNAWFHALGVPLLAWAGLRLSGWGSAFFAAGAFAAWPILVSHPIHGAYSYQAPVFVAIAVVCAIEAQRSNKPSALYGTAVALAAAVSIHPAALPIAAGAVVMLRALSPRYSARQLLSALALGLLMCSPWLLDNALHIWQRHNTGAVSNPQDVSMVGISVWALLDDALGQTISGWSPLVAMACIVSPIVAALAIKDDGAVGMLAGWMLAGGIGLVIFVAVLSYIQPYHWALWLPIAFVATPAALGRLTRTQLPTAWRVPLGAFMGAVTALAAVAATHRVVPALVGSGPPHVEQRAIIQAASDAISAHAANRPRTFAVVTDATGNIRGEPIALFFEQWMRGEADDRFPTDWVGDGPRVYVLAGLSNAQWTRWPIEEKKIAWSLSATPDHSLKLLAFETTESATVWLVAGCPLRATWPALLVQGPAEGLGGLAGAESGADRRLTRWARICPEDPVPGE